MIPATKSGVVLSDVSVLMLTYRHENFVGAAIQSILSQTRPPSQLVVMDDCSPDETWSAVQRAVAGHEGPTQLVLVRNPARCGAARSKAQGLAHVTGRLIVNAHGDDVSLPTRLERLHAVWQQTGASSMSHDVFEHVDGQRLPRRNGEAGGDQQLPLEDIAAAPFHNRLLGCTMAIDRAVLDRFPVPDEPPGVAPGPGDIRLPLRGALLGGHWYLDEALVEWRRHDGQMTSRIIDQRPDHPAAGLETLEAFFVYGQVQRLRDLSHHAQSEGSSPELAAARQATLAQLLKRLRNWSAARDRLREEGMVATWEGGIS